jgi:hypothetical protein
MGHVPPPEEIFHRDHINVPYLIHSGYELPLLLDGRKEFARVSGFFYPPMTFDGKHCFDDWVAEGLLHREEVLEPFDSPFRGYLGRRTVYYTQKGQEWRIPAWKQIKEASGKSGGWNENFERLDGMLFGYEDWQNDWWIDRFLQVTASRRRREESAQVKCRLAEGAVTPAGVPRKAVDFVALHKSRALGHSRTPELQQTHVKSGGLGDRVRPGTSRIARGR